MFPVSSIGNDISSDLVRRKMNDLPESPIGNNLEALAPGIEKLKQTSIHGTKTGTGSGYLMMPQAMRAPPPPSLAGWSW